MDNYPNQNGPSFEPVKPSTLEDLSDAVLSSPEIRQYQSVEKNQPFFELELVNRDAEGDEITIYAGGKDIVWFGREVVVYKVELMSSITPQGWLSTEYFFVESEEGFIQSFKQQILVDDEDVQSFWTALHRALNEADEESFARLYEHALKYRDEKIQQAKALKDEYDLGMTDISEQEVQVLINYVKTGWPYRGNQAT